MKKVMVIIIAIAIAMLFVTGGCTAKQQEEEANNALEDQVSQFLEDSGVNVQVDEQTGTVITTTDDNSADEGSENFEVDSITLDQYIDNYNVHFESLPDGAQAYYPGQLTRDGFTEEDGAMFKIYNLNEGANLMLNCNISDDTIYHLEYVYFYPDCNEEYNDIKVSANIGAQTFIYPLLIDYMDSSFDILNIFSDLSDEIDNKTNENFATKKIDGKIYKLMIDKTANDLAFAYSVQIVSE